MHVAALMLVYSSAQDPWIIRARCDCAESLFGILYVTRRDLEMYFQLSYATRFELIVCEKLLWLLVNRRSEKRRIKPTLRPPVQVREGRLPSRPSCCPPSVSFRDQDFVQRGDIPGRPLPVAIGRGKWNNSSRVAAAPPRLPCSWAVQRPLFREALCCGDKALAGIKEGGVKSAGPWEGERAQRKWKRWERLCLSSHRGDKKQKKKTGKIENFAPG